MLVTKPYIKPYICFAESSEKELLSVHERIQKTERESSVALGICQFHDQLSQFKMSGKQVKRKSGS